MSDRIDLAHAAEFDLGRLRVRPGVRQLVRDDGTEEVLEPRVMQVLVALARADGGILSRDDLTRCCWEGRVVGEDAINRVISRLRRSAEGIGAGSFRIETITKVGYRLTEDERPRPAADAPPAVGSASSRRGVLIAAGAALAAAAGGALLVGRGGKPDQAAPADVAGLVAQGMASLSQVNAEGSRQAISIFREVTRRRPDYPDGWGVLAFTYAIAARSGPGRLEAENAARSTEAARRALALDPGNIYARAALAMQLPWRGNWLRIEQALRAALADRPAAEVLLVALSMVLIRVGRMREAASLLDRAVADGTPTPGLLYGHLQALWSARRLEDFDRAMQRADELYASHFAIWFTHCYTLLFAGRTDEAIAFAEAEDRRPTGIQQRSFELVLRLARAIRANDAGAIDAAVAENVAAAHDGAGFAENAIQFAAFTGRLDAAFAVAEAYFFNRGFTVADLRFSREQPGYTRLADRRTQLLFLPSTAAMRTDPRLGPILRELGLEAYWTRSGTLPDYRRERA